MVQIRKILAYVLLFVLCFSFMPVFPEAVGGQADIVIRDVGDFLTFAIECRNQDYSQKKTVLLEVDLDLNDVDISPIPTFFGNFDGNGHTIYGVTLTGAGSNIGLFRFVEEDAEISNLNVSGVMAPSGSCKKVGGIAGTNRGKIINCSFSGSIKAKEMSGGIVGFNEKTGSIVSCTNWAELTGNREVGGIAGKNEGTIHGSVNEGAVNTNADGVEDESGLSADRISVSMDLEVNREEFRQELQSEKVNNVGGIAGFSSGTIRECNNRGAVGYKSVGYNIGGIVGRHNGLVMMCVNSGDVTGRKDVGGIAGQLEPFLSIEYGDSTIDQVSDIMDELLNTKDSMSEKIENTSDNTTDHVDRMDDILKQIKGLTRDQKADQREKRREYEDKAGRELDEIDEILANMELDLGSHKADQAARRLRGDVSSIKNLLGQLGGDDLILDKDNPAENFVTILEYYVDIATRLENSANDMVSSTDELITSRIDGIDDGINRFRGELDELRIAVKDFLDETRAYKDQLLEALEGVDDDVTIQLDQLYDELDHLSDTLKSGRENVRGEKEVMDRQIDEIQAAIQNGRSRLKQERDDFMDSDTLPFEDISDHSAAMGNSVTMECSNTGNIFSDYQCGGIVGTVGLEIGADPEKDIEKYGDRSLYITRSAAAYVQECRNDGTVAAQRDYVGGIVGAAWIGALKNNQNYGDICSKDGNYVGGIAGGSQASITGSYSMCEVSGRNDVGGIAGSVKIARDNCAMASVVSDGGERIGSVIGGREENSEIHGNVFVDEGLGAIDGVTYEKEAVGLSYEELSKREGVPEEFLNLKVAFFAGDVLVKQIICQYGDAITDSEIPEIPKKDGFFENWQAVDLSSIRHNYKIYAEYHPWVYTISNSDDPKPELLAEAHFLPTASLSLETLSEQERTQIQVLKDGRILEAFQYQARDVENENPPKTVVLHVLSHGADLAGLVTENTITLVDAKNDGEYLVFEAPAVGKYVLIKTIPKKQIAVGLIALTVAGFFLFRKKPRRKERKEITQEETDEKQNHDEEKNNDE